MKRNYMLVAFLSLFVLSGCVSNLSGTSYSRDEARQVQQVKLGVVLDVQLVQIEGTKSGIGAIAGGAAGGIAGSTIGSGKGSDIAAIAGAVAGGLLGGQAEEAYTREQGVQLTIELSDGTYISVVQQADPNVQFYKGDSVKVLTANGVSRVIQ
ncbi:glycine zipper 2TM domain-containing protein [Aestuariirhabdus sp. Z084]|uniref:glycine zipper 2TM domain-containing protein n=1 Tax=Aestuariirhabdus haliotis TaxID=2918751 RepID=UPI00201B3DAD|nr:glycine zipper 2TM domain-containing protein [Aestuariirhabdus haliotis]MCL6417480.1 glycine zipper 2TM domain-containing protein [Aestuariirhabdus haliotis]MCL6421434.1 glycine zipper 2TM domain-containing protein [Aestuariirhabdus haliotis]